MAYLQRNAFLQLQTSHHEVGARIQGMALAGREGAILDDPGLA